MEQIQIIKKYPVIRQLLLYGIIGGGSSFIDTVSFIKLRNLGLEVYAANFIGINIGITVSFFLNTFLNFRTKDNLKKRAISFFTIGYIGLVMSMVLMFMGHTLMNIEEIVVKIASIFIVAACQFILNKLFTFKNN